ncbi:uncharacterized protein LOC120416111 [Culex pipiens pallens]|uniref:uncharacterized protein LOC120416111 n=1 Tax=Culex pipiens pallens TaxID=42434 RepID=UPI001954A8BB|nr:uncharacterized protein LOC120416111 [Culex pipiens pallens]
MLAEIDLNSSADDDSMEISEKEENITEEETGHGSKQIKTPKYTLQDLQAACEAVQNGMSISVASKKFGVPGCTLERRVRTKKQRPLKVQKAKYGGKYQNSMHKELPIVKSLQGLSDAGFDLTNSLIRSHATDYIKAHAKLFPTEKSLPSGSAWVVMFLKRHPRLSQCISENKSHYGSVTEASERVSVWFGFVSRYLAGLSLQAVLESRRQVFTMDDMILRKSRKDVIFTCLFGANANGNLLPPLVLYPESVKIPMQKKQIELNYVVANPSTATKAADIFHQWLSRVFQPWLIEENIPRPVILFVDGQRHQITYASNRFCQLHQIVLVSLLPRTVHQLRPLNAKLFESISKLYREEMQSFGNGKSGEHLVLKPTLEQIADTAESIIRDGFLRSKIYPWNPDDSQPAPIVAYRVRKNAKTQPPRRVLYPGSPLFRSMLEARMSKELLVEFQAQLSGGAWQGPAEHTSLFRIWRGAGQVESKEASGEVGVSLADSEVAQEESGECSLDIVKEEPKVNFEDL